MAQADRMSTAIRELVSHGWRRKSIDPVRLAHAEFDAALAGTVPAPIWADADAKELEGRADRHICPTSIIAGAAQHIPDRTLDRCYLDNLFRDLSAGVLDAIRNAAQGIRRHENWRAS
jgi:hypothetical protein